MFDLKDKVVIVTGSAGGLGRAYVEAFAEAGARVAIADIDNSAAEALTAELVKKNYNVMSRCVDVSNLAQCNALAKDVWECWQGIDVLVNNAANYTMFKRKSFMDITGDEWDQVMAVNLRGMLFCVQAVFPYLKQRNYGKIVNISSSTIFKGSPYFLHYVTSKAGVVGFTRALARELGDYNITVNAVAPGLTATDANKEVTPLDRIKNATTNRCLKRHELPEDLVGTVLFLASPYSDFITGQLINVDGGASMH